tara:strand:- start:13978 stop:14946 length:969 start_codon:yes stop_codon:yes gene_type:complete
MKQLTNEAFSPEESKKIYDNFLSIIGTRRDKLVKRYGSEAEKVAYAKAVKQVKKQAEKKSMEKEIEEGTCGYGVDGKIGNTPAGPSLLKLKEMVKDALKNPKKADLNKDGKLSDYEKKRGAAIEKSMMKEFETDEELIADEPISEDIDLGHQDDEPGMLKADVYRIGKYAMELYKMLDKFDKMDNEVDFPHWWQSKISKSKDMIVSAKHYLDFEMKEPQIDAMVDVASEEGVIDESLRKKLAETFLQKLHEDPDTTRAVKRLEPILLDILNGIKDVDNSQEDTEEDVEQLDTSIDYLASVLTDKSPIDIATDQQSFQKYTTK